MSYDSIFGSESPLSSAESGSYVCSDYPACEWGGECKGNHSYSPQRSEASIESTYKAGDESEEESHPPQSPKVHSDFGVLDDSESQDGVVAPDSEPDD